MYRIKYLILNVVNLSLYVNYHFLETRKKHQKEPKRGYIPPMYRDKCIEIEKRCFYLSKGLKVAISYVSNRACGLCYAGKLSYYYLKVFLTKMKVSLDKSMSFSYHYMYKGNGG